MKGHSAHRLAVDVERGEQRRQADDHTDVEDVRSDDVAHRHVGPTLEPGQQADRQLGERGAHRDDREADDGRRDAGQAGEGRGTADQCLAAARQQADARDNEPNGRRERHSARSRHAALDRVDKIPER
jgi:hypothetical protein